MSLLDALLLDPPRIDVWVANRAGQNVAGSGTQMDPYDGSTLTKFDTLMSGMPVNTCVHLGPGEFETAGFFDGMTSTYWRAKTGLRIVGSGIDVTKLKLVNGAASDQRVYTVATPLRTPLVTAVTSFGSLRNNYAGWVGFQFVVGDTPLVVTEVGRWVVSGNNQSHTVKLFNADGTAVPNGSVSVNTSGKPAGQFAYATLATPVTLAAGTTYALMSQETNGGDQWYDYSNTRITLAAAASGVVGAYGANPPPYTVIGAGQSYGPVSLRYGTMADFFELSDLTINCNLAGVSGATSTAGAVRIMGNHSRVVRVKVTNWGNKSTSQEGFVIAMLTGDPGSGVNSVTNCGIEECIAVSPDASAAGKVTVLHVGGKEDATSAVEAFGLGPYIRNCFVDCGQTSDFSKDFRALSMAWCKGGVIEANQVHNTKYGGPYQTATGARDLVVRNNTYRNVWKGPYWSMASQGVQRLVVEGNSIELATGAPSSECAVQLHSTAPSGSYPHGNVVIRDNRIRYVDGGTGSAGGIKVWNAQNLLVRENTLELTPTLPERPLMNKNCGTAQYFENRTPAGVLIRGYNETTSIFSSELETDAEDAFILGLIKKH